MEQITYISQADNSIQPTLVCAASGTEARPLAVCLHTWSYGLEQPCEHFLEQCRKRNWHFVFPHFRGPNWNPEACGSDLVVSDLESIVHYMKEHYPIDEKRIYLVGGSGGGHASMLMAGRKPELWSAVSSWCPISDLGAWYNQTHCKKANLTQRGYDDHIYEACGGNPFTDTNASAQAKHRSPLTWLKNAKGNVIVDIGTGIHDGHTGSVPISHAILAYNEIAEPQDRICQEDIDYMAETEKIPEHLQFQGEDPAYGSHKVLLRRTSGKVRLTIFEGGHDILAEPAFGFLENQTAGKDPVWYSGEKTDTTGTELTK